MRSQSIWHFFLFFGAFIGLIGGLSNCWNFLLITERSFSHQGDFQHRQNDQSDLPDQSDRVMEGHVHIHAEFGAAFQIRNL